MQYFISFLEGIVTFISPCLLPMLPVYVSYFAGGADGTTAKTLKNAISFVLGFTFLFVAMGALAGAVGGFLNKFRTYVNVVTGLVVIIFGLNYMEVFKLKIFTGGYRGKVSDNMSFTSSFVFGVVFSLGWTPCVGVFLGSALMLASQQASALRGIIMLLLYSLGLGIPFVICALFIDKLKSAFNFIKRNYRVVNILCGVLLVLVGILMVFGVFDLVLQNISLEMNV